MWNFVWAPGLKRVPGITMADLAARRALKGTTNRNHGDEEVGSDSSSRQKDHKEIISSYHGALFPGINASSTEAKSIFVHRLILVDATKF